MSHLTSEELIDGLDGVLTPDRRAHLASCETCQRELAELTSVLSDARHAGIPEPSPLFWQHFSARVSRAIDATPESHRPSWWRWRTLVPLGALATLVVALMSAVPTPQAGDTTPSADRALGAGAADADAADNWPMIANLVGDIDLETASAAGVIEPGSAEQAVLELTAEEQQELTRLLRAELVRAKS